MGVRRKIIGQFVQRLLQTQGIRKPPVDIEQIARQLKVEVKKEHCEGDVSGFLFRGRNANQAVIGVNSRHAENRQRFTIAHELGHYLLHVADALYVDRGFQVKLRSEESSKGTDLQEKEANLFAAELLMPRELLEADLASADGLDLHDEDVIRKLAERYRVSSQALTFRLAYLGHVQLG